LAAAVNERLLAAPAVSERARDLGTVEAIETVRWKAQPNLLWARVHTSAGAIGLGETYYIPQAVEHVIHDLAADLLLGQPAGAISSQWTALFSCTNFFGFAGAEMRALSALDVALWDALGQVTGVPVYQLLGGANRQSVQAYNTCVNAGPNRDWDHAVDDPGDLAAELRDLGYLGMKVWPWDRFAPQLAARGSTGPAGWSSMGPVGSYLSFGDLASGLSMLERARDRIGSSFELLVEGHSRWDVNMAIRICRALEPLNVLWVEDICQPDSAEDLARLVRETRVPQAVSERLISRFAFREVLRHQAAHVVLVDVAWTGGLSEAKRVAELASTYHLSFAPHDCTGPVTALANLHLAIAQPNCIGVEVVRGFVDGYYRQVLDTSLHLTNGRLAAPDKPGLGAALSADFLAQEDVEVRLSK
jgi:L-alanine-DL-glutamate epimerase-like enolase superfamily enzyme